MRPGEKAERRESYIYSTVNGIKASPREPAWTDGEPQPQRLGAAGQTIGDCVGILVMQQRRASSNNGRKVGREIG
jgi:hypothetical protein